MNTYLIYDADGYIVDDIKAPGYSEMLDELRDRILSDTISLLDLQSASIHMILKPSLTEFLSDIENEIIEESEDFDMNSAMNPTCDEHTQYQNPEALLTQEIEALITAHKEELGIKKVTIIVDCKDSNDTK